MDAFSGCYFNTKFASNAVLMEWMDYLMKSIYINMFDKKIVSYGKMDVSVARYLDKGGCNEINSFFDEYNFEQNIEYEHISKGTRDLHFQLGKDTKGYIGEHTEIQMNKISDETLARAAHEFLAYLESEEITFDMDEFSPASHEVFTRQEREYLSGAGFRLFSMLTLAFLQMGILEMDDSF